MNVHTDLSLQGHQDIKDVCYIPLHQTDLFTNLEPQNPSVDDSELHKIPQSPDVEAINL